MNVKAIRHLSASFALACLLAPVALAEPPADKGKNANAAQPAGKERDHDKDDDHERGDDGNRGQVVSECNHRANEKKLQGKERKEYVEWCTDNGEHAKYDDRRYDQDRSCYRKADEKGLSGDFRRVFIQDCLRRQGKDR